MIDFSIADFFVGAEDATPVPASMVDGKALMPVHPNAGIEAAYRKRLTALIDEMHKSVIFWIRAAYKADPPAIAQDELSSSAMRAAIRKLAARWTRRFDNMATQMAAYFAKSVSDRSDAALKKILKDGGFSIQWKMTRAQKDVLDATVHENVALIKSIPAQYLTKVEGAVMRSVQTGRDLKQLTDDLQNEFGVTRRRAILIARTQNNMATAALTRARQTELGITHAKWLHSGGGHEPRPSHRAMSGQIYEIAKGMFDPDENKFVIPGQLINCRCVSRPIIRGIGG